MSRRLRNQPHALLLAAFLSTAVSAQSFVGGESSGQAPFSLPPSIFSDLTTNANSDVEFPITGYDVSTAASSSDATGNTINGWSLDVHLTANVPLSKSDDTSINKDQFFQATKMALIPPNGDMAAFNVKDWQVCGIVFTGGLTQASEEVAVGSQGSCASLLPDDCIQQIQVNGVSARNKTAGDTIASGGAGRCEDLELPSVCDEYFQGTGGGSAFEIKPFNSSETNTGRLSFFAAGSAPTQNNDRDSIQAAEKFIWPVLLTWTHFGQGSNGQQDTAHDSAGWLSCVQAPNTTTDAVVNGDDGGKDSGAGDRLAVRGFSMWAGIVGLGVFGLAAVL